MKSDIPSQNQSVGRRANLALISLFAVFLLLPLLDLAFHLDPTTPPSENRLLAALPHRPDGFAGLKRFLAGWETYFNDHFGFRKTMVTWNNKLKWSLFEEKNTRNVLVGTSGWMFQSERQMVEHFRGTLLFTEPELQAWQKLLEHRRDWFAQRGIKYLFVLAPDKHSVYPEFLPVWLKDLGGRTKADQFFDYMKTHSTVAVLDLRPTLLAAKKSGAIYLKTDTHWNQLGAFYACEQVIETLGQHQLPGLGPLPLAAFDRTNQLAPGGDLVNLRGIRIRMAESNAIFMTPKTNLPGVETCKPAGEHFMEEATVKNPHGRGLAMVYTDSFGRGWIPFLGYQFGEVDFYWQYHIDGPLIERHKPVVVITEMLERFFNVPDPRDLPSQDVLP